MERFGFTIKFDVHFHTIPKITCKRCIVKGIIPFPVGTSLVIIEENPAQSFKVFVRNMSSKLVHIALGLKLITKLVLVITLLPALLMQLNIVFGILKVWI